MILRGDCLQILPTLEAGSVQCCVTSPPYFGLRDYGVDGQIGHESIPDCLGWATGEPCGECFVCAMVRVFRGVRRALRDDGTLWLNLGDSYASKGGLSPQSGQLFSGSARQRESICKSNRTAFLPAKNLIGVPWRVALALQADGWILRQDIIWSKPNPMPESVTDRCTKAHEYIFLFSKSESYHFDAAAIAEPLAGSSIERLNQPNRPNQEGSHRVPGKTNGTMKAVGPRFGGDKYGDDSRTESRTKSGNEWAGSDSGRRNKRSVWSVATMPFKEAHFATFPPSLIEPCILAGAPAGTVVLDPFLGAGTTAIVAERLGRKWVGIELNPESIGIADRRIGATQPGLCL